LRRRGRDDLIRENTDAEKKQQDGANAFHGQAQFVPLKLNCTFGTVSEPG